MYEVAIILSLVTFVGVCWAFVLQPSFSIFHPLTFYAAFHGLVFVFRPIVAYFGEYDMIYALYQFMPSASDKLTVILASNLGFVTFAFFAMRAGNAPMVFKTDGARLEERRLLRTTLPYLIPFALIGIYSLLTALEQSATGQGLANMRMMENGVRVNTSGNGYITDAKLLLVPICGLLAWFYRFKWYSLLPLVAFFILKASTGGRGPFVVAVAIAGLFYLYEKRSLFPATKLVAAAAAMLVFFSAVGEDRGLAIREALGVQEVEVQATPSAWTSEEGRFLEGMDFANMEYFEYLVYVVPQRSGTFDYFLANLQILTEPIPRVLWPGKPAGAPIQPVQLWEFGSPIGMTASLPGIGWYELGWVGVVVWCGLWGWLAGKFYNRFATGPQDTISVAIYLVSIPILLIAYRDGVLLTIIKLGAFYIIPVLLIAFLRSAFKIPTLAEIAAGSGRLDDEARRLWSNLTPAQRRRNKALEWKNRSERDRSPLQG